MCTVNLIGLFLAHWVVFTVALYWSVCTSSSLEIRFKVAHSGCVQLIGMYVALLGFG